MKRALVALVACGCAGPIDVTRQVTAREASAANGTKLHAVAIVRGQARAPLPDGASIVDLEARVPRPGVFTYALDPGDKVVYDDQKRVTGVKSGEHVTRFIAGTATVEGNEVKGELEDHVERLSLLDTDRVELRGTFAPGESVPTGGKVSTTRAWSALGFGAALLGGAWLPSVIVAATSDIDANHWLYVPVAGPWVAYATRDACTPDVDPRPCLNDAGARIGLIIDGILQTTGFGLLLVGLPSSAEIQWNQKDGTTARVRIEPFSGRISGVF
ncbi:MAG TPA: hypothetical protein VGH87_10365 [Polyangiaceae bacterium]|jgi:hypothetical protein